MRVMTWMKRPEIVLAKLDVGLIVDLRLISSVIDIFVI